MDILELKNIIQSNGVVGAGGAGFPSYAKLNEGIDTIILNCAECEPLLKLHQQLLALKADEIVNTLNYIASVIGAKDVVIATKECYVKTVQAIETAIEERFFQVNMKLSFLPEIYPAGDEIITIYETTGRLVEPGKLPLSVGVIVYNVETVYNIYKALFEDKPVTHKYITIAGEVKEPKTIKVPIGITFDEVLKLAGGPSIENPALIQGGPMTGALVKEIDVVTKTTNGLLVFPQDQYIVRKKSQNISISVKRAKSVCCQCNKCTEMCPRYAIGYPIEPHALMRNVMSVDTANIQSSLNTFFCSQCGICEMYACEQCLSPQTLINECRTQLRNNGIMAPKDVPLSKMNKLRKERMISLDRLKSRLGISKYDVSAPLSIDEISTNKVKIKLSQHIGVPSIPVVEKGELVEEGQMISKAKENSLSVPCHSSIAGIVLEVNEKYIIICKR